MIRDAARCPYFLLLTGWATPDGNGVVLLFNGSGTSPDDVAAIESILDDMHVTYSEVSSRGLNRMSEAQLSAHRLLTVPGGNFEVLGSSLRPEASANIRKAVQSGLNYPESGTLDQYWERWSAIERVGRGNRPLSR